MLTMLSQIISCLAVLAVLPRTVDSAAAFNPLVSCKTITPTDGESFEVCASFGSTTPSPAQFENGTTLELGGWSYNYNIYHPVADGAVEGDEDFPSEAYVMNVLVTRSDAGDCNVTATPPGENMTMCSSCTYCGNETGDDTLYSADCTNLENGREVECETTDVVFFPFTAAAIPNVTIPDDGPSFNNPTNTSDDGGSDGNNPTNTSDDGGSDGSPASAPAPSPTSDSSPSKINTSMLLLKMISSLIILALVV